jgi:conjugative transfer pilus assembly protein TraH
MINGATNNNYSGTSSYETQKFGYHSLGGAQYRIPLKRDPLVSFASPSFEVGCGGLDIFFGGIGFMNADYLVQKTKRSLQASPYVAFDLGMKALCSECSEVMKTVEQMGNFLNSMSFDECAAAKTMVTVSAESVSTIAKGGLTVDGTLTGMKDRTNQGLNSFFEDAKPRSQADRNRIRNDAVNRLPTSVAKMWLNNGGSLLELIRTEFNIPASSINTARAYFGDIFYDKSNGNFVQVLICANLDGATMEQLIHEQLLSRTVTDLNSAMSPAPCTATEIPMDLSKTSLTDVGNGIQNRTALNANTINFVNKANMPVFSILARSYGVSPEYGNTMRDFLMPITAGSYVYNPLTTVASIIMLALDDIDNQQQTSSVYGESNINLQKYRKDVNATTNTIRTMYQHQLSQNYTLWNMITSINQGEEESARAQVRN